MTRAEIVQYVIDHPGLTTRQISDAHGLSPGNAGEHLCRAADDGVIVRDGVRGAYTWRVRGPEDGDRPGARRSGHARRAGHLRDAIVQAIGEGAALTRIARTLGRTPGEIRPPLRRLLTTGEVRQIIRPGYAEQYIIVPPDQRRQIIPPTIP